MDKIKNISKFIYLVAIIFLFGFAPFQQKNNEIKSDVCILGGSEAGFTAAIQAVCMGKNVVLIEPTGHPGGMMTEGIVKDIRFDISVVISGIAREIYTEIEAYYGREPKFGQKDWYSPYEPKIAEEKIEKFLTKDSNIRIIRKTRIMENGGVQKVGASIKSILLENGKEIFASVFIDASIEGHLLHFAGVTTETIREGNQKYGEPKNGIQVENNYRQFEVNVDPYIIQEDPASGLIPTIQTCEIGEFGSPSKYIQGYCFRLCLTKNESNRILIPKPANYNPATYEIYKSYLKAGGKLFQPGVNRENGKTDLGSWHDLSENLYGENWMYPEGNYATQDSVVQYHKDFTQGLIWFLQNDPEVDTVTRKNWEGWGLCKDKYTDNKGWSRRLYIRSARRMVSDDVITEHQTKRENTGIFEDPVAIAWWPPDTHHTRRIVKNGFAYNEGFVFGGKDWRPFGVSWRALIPRDEECTNLITPTCPSSSYVAYGTIRIVPTFLILGESAGCAASIAVENRINVQDVDYDQLKTELLKNNQILNIPDDWLRYVMFEE